MRYITLLILAIFLIYGLYKNQLKNNKFMTYFFYWYVLTVITITLLPIHLEYYQPAFDGSVRINLIPFHDLHQSYGGAFDNIIYNIMMFIPLGMFLGYFKKNTYFALFTIVNASICIEFLQLYFSYLHIMNRSYDVTDLITNIFGGIIGYCFYNLFCKR